MCHLFPALSPWNVYDLTLRRYLMFTGAVDARRQADREASRG